MNKQVLLLYALALFLAVGCGEDKNSSEAKNFETSKNLDSGNYQAVLDDPNANATDYAAAAMAMVGLDPVDLVKKLNETATTGATGDLGAVTELQIYPENLKYLTIAKDKLKDEIDVKCAGMTPDTASQECKDLNFQQTVTSLTNTVTALAQVGQTYSASIVGGFNATDGISQGEASALATFLTNKYTGTGSVTVDVGTGTPQDIISVVTKDIVTLVSEDATAIVGTTGTVNGSDSSLAMSGLGGSDLQNTINSSITNIGGAAVSPTTITDYLNTNFAN